MWKGEVDGATVDVDGVGTVWPKSMTGMYDAEKYDLFFVTTPSIVDTWEGETSGVKVELSVLLEVMMAWVKKVLV